MDINAYLYGRGLYEVSYYDFYRDIFPEGSFEEKGHYEKGKYNAIIVEITDEVKADGRAKILRHTLTDELDKLDDVASRDNFCLMSPISYAGKSRKSSFARFIYAIAIDLDGVVVEKNLDVLFEQIERNEAMLKREIYWGLPAPTYFVSSGTGLHLYYVLEEPIPLFKNIVEQLEVLKRRLTWQAWTQGASVLQDNIQYESLFQGFRMVGTSTKAGGITRAFRYAFGKKYTLEELNRNVPVAYRVNSIVYKSELTLDKAKEKYPEWYQKRIVQQQPKGTWVCKRDLYDWWVRQIYDGAVQGHRYWCVLTLATYAKKCGIEYDELVADGLGLVDFLNSRGDEFTTEDVMKAMEAYNDDYITYPIDTITARTGIAIKKNKRNGRKRDSHLERARAVQRIDYPNGEWRYIPPTSEQKVREWQQLHPEGRKAECIRDTGLSKPTVYKWWKKR